MDMWGGKLLMKFGNNLCICLDLCKTWVNCFEARALFIYMRAVVHLQ